MPLKDKIIEEIHRVREEFTEKYDFNVRAMLEDLQKQQSKSNREYVSFAPQKVKKKVPSQNSGVKNPPKNELHKLVNVFRDRIEATK